MRIHVLVGAWIASLSGAALADAVDVNLNSDSIQATYTAQVRTADVSLGFLNNDERDNWVASAGLLVFGDTGSKRTRTEVGLGGKAYYADVGNLDIYALGLGGQVRVFPNNGPIGIAGSLFYAPDIVTSGDGKEFWEAGARIEFEVIPDSASVYVGYRKVRTELETGGHATIDSGGHAGLQLRF